MGLTYTRDDDRRRVTVTVSDPFTLDEMLSAIQRQAVEGTWQYGAINDRRALSTTVLTSDDLRQCLDLVVKLSRTYGHRGPVAVVYGRSVQYGMTRMYSMMADGVFDVEG